MQVEKHIPKPAERNWKARLDKMQVGESIRINSLFCNSVKSAMSQHYHKRLHKAFTTAKDTDGFFRVWRVG